MASTLSRLVNGLPGCRIIGNQDVEIDRISFDSRDVSEGDLFFCLKGANHDGHQFAHDAVQKGARAVVAENQLELKNVTQVLVSDTRGALAYVSSRFYGDPSRKLTVIGVTGTNGKTTTAHYVKSIIEASGKQVGLIGTLGHAIGPTTISDRYTTPEASYLQSYLADMLGQGITFAVMEVSSHAIALKRVNHIDFNVVCFTNLTRDHLDFHHTLDDYRKTKMRLLGIGDEGCDFGERRKAIINVGDKTGKTIAELSPLSKLTYSIGQKADVTGEISNPGRQGCRLVVKYDSRKVAVDVNLRGLMNAENALAAFCVGLTLGIEEEAIREGISSVRSIPGRMEFIESGGRTVIVDYAHTPDALKRLLIEARELGFKRVICVFGCGGDRDPGKRPEMGQIAASLADITIVTSDNPRTEDPLKIINEIVAGIPPHASYQIIPDRGDAILRAVEMSGKGDVVVIAGKGHEDYQIVGTRRIHFDDREVAKKALGLEVNA